ncbi:exosporium leader peptide-containing protein, partial [Bacillus cereus]
MSNNKYEQEFDSNNYLFAHALDPDLVGPTFPPSPPFSPTGVTG